jgi:hypothetical protein
MSEPIAGYNPDGTPYYGPDALGLYIGRESDATATEGIFASGPTPSQMSSAGVPSGASSTGASSTPGYSSSAPAYSSNTYVGQFFNEIGNIDKEFPLLGSLDNAFNLNPNTSGSLTASNGPIATAGSSVSSLLAIVTNVPRMVTIIVGIILLIVGLFMLGVRPAVQVVGKVKDAVGPLAEAAA